MKFLVQTFRRFYVLFNVCNNFLSKCFEFSHKVRPEFSFHSLKLKWLTRPYTEMLHLWVKLI